MFEGRFRKAWDCEVRVHMGSYLVGGGRSSALVGFALFGGFRSRVTSWGSSKETKEFWLRVRVVLVFEVACDVLRIWICWSGAWACRGGLRECVLFCIAILKYVRNLAGVSAMELEKLNAQLLEIDVGLISSLGIAESNLRCPKISKPMFATRNCG
ncbi:hypothetical protein Drorol1_Dr00020879 [Drosera rotundifolia]